MADPNTFRLTKILLGQYNHNLQHSTMNKISYNRFQPYTFFGNTEIYLSLTDRITFVKILNRDYSRVRKQDFIIKPERGSIKFAISKKYITVDITAIIIVAKAELRNKVPK